MFYATVFTSVVLALVLTLLLRTIAAGFILPIGSLTLKLILAVPVLAVCGTFAPLLLKRSLSRFLRRELLGRGVPICMGCGYHLIGLPGSDCPECGRPIDRGVRAILNTRGTPTEPRNSTG